MLYFLPIKDWYFLSNAFLKIDLNRFVPLSKVRLEANKRIIFALWITAIGLHSTDFEMLCSILREECNSYQELEQKFGEYDNALYLVLIKDNTIPLMPSIYAYNYIR